MDCEPFAKPFSKPSEYWTVCCRQLEFDVAAGGVGYVGLRKHAIVGVSSLFVTTDSQATTCTDRIYYGKLAIGHHRRIKWLAVWQGALARYMHGWITSILLWVVSSYFPTREALRSSEGRRSCRGGEREKRVRRKREKGRYDTVEIPRAEHGTYSASKLNSFFYLSVDHANVDGLVYQVFLSSIIITSAYRYISDTLAIAAQWRNGKNAALATARP